MFRRDIKASAREARQKEHGVLSLTIPKKEVRKLPGKKTIMIEG